MGGPNGQQMKARHAKKSGGTDSALGTAFNAAKLKQRRGLSEAWAQGRVAGERHTTDDSEGRGGLQSLWEMNDLRRFFHQAEQQAKDFAAERDTRVSQGGVTHVVRDDKMRPFSDQSDASRWYELSQRLPIPVRPPWTHDMRKDDIETQERQAFIEWRRQLASIEEREGVVLTPFERNLEVWRQLWRVVERSDVVMMIVDARNPLAFRSRAAERAVKDAGKQLVLLLNKAELLTARQRRAWGRYFQQEGTVALFFSAAAAKAKQELLEGRDATKGRVGQEVAGDFDRVAEDHAALQEELEMERAAEMSPEEDEEEEPAPAARAGGKKKKPRRNQRKLRGAPQMVQDAAPWSEPSGTRKQKVAEPPAPPGDEEVCRSVRVDAVKKMGGLQVAHQFHSQEPERIYSPDELLDYALLHRGDTAMEGPPVMLGFVGYPNVGKSSTINVLWQSKKVNVSATPGKTKHFQTLRLEHERRVMLCDCPGLVFPSFASTRDHMIVDGILPISQLRDAVTTMQIVTQRVPTQTFELLYTLNLDSDEDESPTLAHRVANAYARARGYMTDHNKPNTNRGARDILRDYVEGKLVYVWPPPRMDGDSEIEESEDEEEDDDSAPSAAGSGAEEPDDAGDSDDDEFEEDEEDLDEGALIPPGITAEDWADVRMALGDVDPEEKPKTCMDPRSERFNRDNANMTEIYDKVLRKRVGHERKEQRKLRGTRNHQLAAGDHHQRDDDGNVVVEVSDDDGVKEIEVPLAEEQPVQQEKRPTKRQLRRMQHDEMRQRVGVHRQTRGRAKQGAAGYTPTF